MPFTRGEVITRREVLHGRPWLTHPVEVVADDGHVVAVLLEPGSPFTFHDHPFGKHPWARSTAWGGATVLQLHREGDAYSVWKFFEPSGGFRYWYVNFERPVVRCPDGIETDDMELDLIQHPDGRLEWKDVEGIAGMVTSGRATREEMWEILETAAAVHADLTNGRRWWSPWDEWTPGRSR